MSKLPEFRVTLTRLKRGERAFPTVDAEGRRTKLGGDPDYIQGDQPLPKCPECGKSMLFVAQIDSVEHDWDSNPHAVDALSQKQKWMFGDVGMIYVFFCQNCLIAGASFECG